MDILCNYAAYRQCVPILVFDAYKAVSYTHLDVYKRQGQKGNEQAWQKAKNGLCGSWPARPLWR